MTIHTSMYAYAKQSFNRVPDKVAIWYNDKGITFRELFNKIDKMADHLYELGVREGTVVTIHLPNCPETIYTVYAVAKLGGISSMVHPLTPVSDFDEYLSFTKSRFLLTSSAYSGKNITVLYYSQLDELLESNIESAIIPSQIELAEKCAVYMSSTGTIGDPKVVMLSHKAMNAYPQDMAPHFYYHLEEMVGLSVAPFFHTFGLSGDVHRTLSCGSQMVILPRWNADKAVELIQKYKVNLISAPPKVYYDLLANPHFVGEAIKQIHYCFLGGDTIPQSLMDDIDARIGNGRVAFPVYGMTELGAGVCAITKRYDRRGSCGYPILNALIRVRNSEGKILKAGEGEIVASSENMMIGYYNNESATEKMFLEIDDRRWIRTGDFGRIDEDGFVYFVCRMKNIIIHNGYNIYPGEIESPILSVPNVAEVCAFGKKNEHDSEDVFVAVVLQKKEDARTTLSHIKKAYEQALPRYAFPKSIVFIEKLPRNALNKIDTERLREII